MNAEFELERGNQFVRLKNWLNLNSDVNNAALIYALAETIQDRLDRIDLTDVQKGAILSDLFNGLMENNKVEIAANREFRSILQQGQRVKKH